MAGQCTHRRKDDRRKSFLWQSNLSSHRVYIQRFPDRTVFKICKTIIRAGLSTFGFGGGVVKGDFVQQAGCLNRQTGNQAFSVEVRTCFISIVGQAVHCNHIHGIGSIVPDAQGELDRVALLYKGSGSCFGQADRIVLADLNTHFCQISVRSCKITLLFVTAPDNCLIQKLVVVFDISIFIFGGADLAGVVDGIKNRNLFICNGHIFQNPVQRGGAIAVFRNLWLHGSAARNRSLLAFCCLLVGSTPVSRTRNVGQPLRKGIFKVQVGDDLCTLGVGFPSGAQNGKVQSVICNALVGVHIIGELLRTAAGSLHWFFGDLGHIRHHKAGVTVAHTCGAACITVSVIFGFDIAGKTAVRLCIVHPESSRIVFLIGELLTVRPAGKGGFHIFSILVIGQCRSIYTKIFGGSGLHIGFVPCLCRVRYHINAVCLCRIRNMALQGEVTVGRLRGGYAACFPQNCHTGIPGGFQRFQGGKEDQVISGGVDHFIIITNVSRLQPSMIPAASIRFCAVEEGLSHVFQTGTAAGLDAFNLKEGIVELDQIIVRCAGVHALCCVVLQHGLNAKLSSSHDPVLAVLVAAIGQRTAVADLAVFLVGHRMVDIAGLFQLIGENQLVIRCFFLIPSSLAAGRGDVQITVCNGQIERASTKFIHNILAVFGEEGLHHPQFTGRKTGGLDVPVVFNGGRVIVDHPAGIGVGIRIGQLVQVDFIVADRDIDCASGLFACPSAAICAAGISVTVQHIERCAACGQLVFSGDFTSIVLMFRVVVFIVAFQTPYQRSIGVCGIVDTPIVAQIFVREIQRKGQCVAIRQFTAAQTVFCILAHQLDGDADHADTSVDIAGIRIHGVGIAGGKIKTADVRSTSIGRFQLDVVARCGGHGDHRWSDGFVFCFQMLCAKLVTSGHDATIRHVVEFQPIGKQRLHDLSVAHGQHTKGNVQLLIAFANGRGIIYTRFP